MNKLIIAISLAVSVNAGAMDASAINGICKKKDTEHACMAYFIGHTEMAKAFLNVQYNHNKSPCVEWKNYSSGMLEATFLSEYKAGLIEEDDNVQFWSFIKILQNGDCASFGEET